MSETSEYNLLMKEFMDLNRQLNEIIEKIERLYESRNTLNCVCYATHEQIWAQEGELIKQELSIKERLISIEDKLFWIMSPIKNNGIIEIRKRIDGRNTNDVTGNYSICLAKKKVVVGEISYRGYHFSKYLADIGYGVDINFRGNDFSYYALCLLGEHLKENGIDDFWISTYKNNIPSVKTIEKYGGVPIKSDENFCLYMAKTFINDKQFDEKNNVIVPLQNIPQAKCK